MLKIDFVFNGPHPFILMFFILYMFKLLTLLYMYLNVNLFYCQKHILGKLFFLYTPWRTVKVFYINIYYYEMYQAMSSCGWWWHLKTTCTWPPLYFLSEYDWFRFLRQTPEFINQHKYHSRMNRNKFLIFYFS